MGMDNSIIRSSDEIKEFLSPITWDISSKIRDDNSYDVKVTYAISKNTSKDVKVVVKRSEVFFHFSEAQLELESRLKDLDNKAKGRFGLPPECGELRDMEDEKASLLRAKLIKKLDTEGFSAEGLEEFFLKSKELREQVISFTLRRQLYDTLDEFIAIKRGEEKISAYVNCVL